MGEPEALNRVFGRKDAIFVWFKGFGGLEFWVPVLTVFVRLGFRVTVP